MTFHAQIDSTTWGFALFYTGPVPDLPVLDQRSICLIFFNIVLGIEW